MDTVRNSILVVVPCGKKKIWGREPTAGPTAARSAYTSPLFGINKTFAEKFGEGWVILSAKYGFMKPTFKIPRNYNVTFCDKAAISFAKLSQQVRQKHLDCYGTIIGLGGKKYCHALKEAFKGASVRLKFPFCGLSIGKMMQATKRAIDANDPFLRA